MTHTVSSNILRQCFTFGTVGIINTALTLGIIYALVEFLGVWYVAGNALGYAAGFINSFVMNKLWTFKSRGPVARESFLFAAVFAACYAVQLGTLLALRKLFAMDTFLSQVISMAPYTALNFLGNRNITFRG